MYNSYVVENGSWLSHLLCIYQLNDTMDCINTATIHALSVGEIISAGLTFAENLEVTSFTNSGLQKKAGQVKRYCTEWSLKFLLNKSNKVGFKNKTGN